LPIVIAVAVIVAIFILRDRITGFRGRFSRKGVHAEIKAAEPESPPATGVDLSGAQFKDHNKFTTGDDARIKAQNMKAGSGNGVSVWIIH